MIHPSLPPALLDRLEPTRRELRAIIAAIHADELNLDLQREADRLNRELLEIEREFFARKEAA